MIIWSKMIVFDVGANKGELSNFLLEKFDDMYVYAIEPNSMLCSDSLTRISRIFPNRFFYLPLALSRNNGRAKLFAPEVLNGQIGSLLHINKSAPWASEITSNLAKGDISKFIEVETRTVARMISSLKLKQIDFLKIDTQGTDLDILEDFFDACEVTVAAVEIEVISDQSLSHYANSRNDILRLFELLRKFQFKVIRMFPVSGDCNEFNVFLAKSVSDYNSIHNLLDFSSLPVFSRYWEVLGIGDKSIGTSRLQKSILKKALVALRHPRKSYRSMLIKLSS